MGWPVMFGIRKYEEIIAKVKSTNMAFSTEWNSENHESTVLLRHDVDFSVDYAHKIAEKEMDLGVNSTYFFMLTSNLYNPLSSKNQTLIRSIQEMGHKISLHFDPTVYPNLDPFLIEKTVFEQTFHCDLDVVSIHRPGIFLDNNNIDLFGISQTYQDRYFRGMVYISDSGGRDPFSPLMEYLAGDRKLGLQLLLHPVWWIEDTPSPTAALNSWKTNHIGFLTDEIRANCKTYLD